MNRTRLISILAGVILAILGIIGLVLYVNNAAERAASGEELNEVWVAATDISPGTTAARIESLSRLETVPAKLVTEGVSVANLADLEGLVVTQPILEGEVINRGRFGSETEFARRSARAIEIPDGFHEVTLALEPDRASFGLMQPGDQAGVVISLLATKIPSLLPREVDGEVIQGEGTTWNSTKLNVVDALVTSVQLEEVPEVSARAGLGEEEDTDIRLVPSGKVLVTLAADTIDVERIIFGMEYGEIWLTVQTGDSDGPSYIQTREKIFVDRDGLDSGFDALDIDSGAVRIADDEVAE